MKLCEAESKINAVQVTEINITNFADTHQVVNAAYALMEYDPKLKKVVGTHGKCTAHMTNWSEDTLQLLKELLESMEADLLPRHFTTQRNSSMENPNDETRTAIRRLEETDQV